MFNYKWYLKDLHKVEKTGLKVFSTFACGGGSTMGYKLAGYDVIGANDIDPKMRDVYVKNHNPRLYYLMPIGELVEQARQKKLPEELYNLDILDGSPPCSTFSMAGSREKAFKKEKVFREGQAKQVLSDLFFDYIDLVGELRPKVAIAENVKGMLGGNAIAYTVEVKKRLTNLGYDVQLFMLNASTMGVPQQRERVFFICRRKDLNLPKIDLNFTEAPITWEQIDHTDDTGRKQLTATDKHYITGGYKWVNGRLHKLKTKSQEVGGVGFYFMPNKKQVCHTITASGKYINKEKMQTWSNKEFCEVGSFPLDYEFIHNDAQYLIGMSVPPLMTANVAYQVRKQIFNK